MLFLIALCLRIFSFLAPAEAMVGSAYSKVRREGDNVPLCAIDQSSAVKSTVSAMWCGIECITSSSSTCDAFSYFETTNKCDIFFFTPTNYAVEDSCVTYAVFGSAAEVVEANPTNVPTSASQSVDVPSSTANVLLASAADTTTASATGASAANTISLAGTPLSGSAATSASISSIISTQQAAVVNAISAAGPISATSATPTANILQSISTQQASAAISISAAGTISATSAAPTANIPQSLSTKQASAAISISANGPTTAATAAPTANIPQSISTKQASAAISISVAGPISAPSAAPTANIPKIVSTQQAAAAISTAGVSTGQLVQTTTCAPNQQPLAIPATPSLPTSTLCDSKIAKTSRILLQQNTGSGLDQTWSAYKNGFKDGTGGYWIGNEILYRMTNNCTTCQMCIDMQTSIMSPPKTWYYAFYSSFVVDSETDGYTFTASGFSGTVVDTFSLSSRISKFNSKDQNNQPSCPNFASSLKGGWWYPCSATQVVLNGAGAPGFFWSDPTAPTGGIRSLQTSYMWIACP